MSRGVASEEVWLFNISTNQWSTKSSLVNIVTAISFAIVDKSIL